MVGSVGVATANWALPWCRTSAPRHATDLRGTFPRRAAIADANVPVGWFIRLCLNDLRGGSRSTRAGDARLAVAAPRGDPSASPVFRCVPVAHTSSPRQPCSTYVAHRRPSAVGTVGTVGIGGTCGIGGTTRPGSVAPERRGRPGSLPRAEPRRAQRRALQSMRSPFSGAISRPCPTDAGRARRHPSTCRGNARRK